MKRLLYFILQVVILFPACTERMVKMTGNVYGTVQDAKTGNPLDNCSVLLNPLGLSTTTGSNGSFYFASIEGGEYSIQTSKSGYITDSKNITVIPDKDNRVDFLLIDETSTKGSIRGKVVDADTQMAIVGCSVILSPGNQSKVTDECGEFLFDNLAPGTYSIRVTKDKYLEQTKFDVIVQADTETSLQFLLYNESTTKGIITGIVRDYETNEVLEGCLVTLQPGGASKLTDSEGYFSFEQLAPTEYEITVTKKDYSSYTKSVTVEPGKSLTVEILLPKESATKGIIEGMVKDSESQNAISYCNVTLVETGTEVETNDSGKFRFENLNPGSYSIQFRKDRYYDQSETGVVVKAKEVTSVEVFMNEISGTQQPPIFGPVSVSNISVNSSRLNCTLYDEGSNIVTERGFLISQTLNPSNDFAAVRVRAAGSGSGDFYGVVTGLSASTLYYVCAYAITSLETSYSDVVSFMTLNQGDISIPSNVFCVALSGSPSRLDRQPGRTLSGCMEGRTGKYKRGSLLHHFQPPEETQSAYPRGIYPDRSGHGIPV